MLYCMGLIGALLWLAGMSTGSELARGFGTALLGCAIGTIIAEWIDRKG